MSDLLKAMPEETRFLIQDLAHRSPSLADLNQIEVKAVASAVLGDFLKEEMKRSVIAERVKFGTEVQLFLSDQKSTYTQVTYGRALVHFGDWLAHGNLNLIDVSPKSADEYVRERRSHGNDEDTVRLQVAAVSSFYTFLERRYSEIRNPFRGTKARPKSSWATAVIPSDEELNLILEAATPTTKALIAILDETGLRVGALPNLILRRNGTYHTVSKGQKVVGHFPLSARVRSLIEEAGLDPSKPFRGEGEVRKVTDALVSRAFRHCGKLFRDGLIAAPYSAHDFRHHFAERNASLGLKRLGELLGHSSVAVTEKYLRNVLGGLETVST